MSRSVTAVFVVCHARRGFGAARAADALPAAAAETRLRSDGRRLVGWPSRSGQRTVPSPVAAVAFTRVYHRSCTSLRVTRSTSWTRTGQTTCCCWVPCTSSCAVTANAFFTISRPSASTPTLRVRLQAVPSGTVAPAVRAVCERARGGSRGGRHGSCAVFWGVECRDGCVTCCVRTF